MCPITIAAYMADDTGEESVKNSETVQQEEAVLAKRNADCIWELAFYAMMESIPDEKNSINNYMYSKRKGSVWIHWFQTFGDIFTCINRKCLVS